ncbi:MAG: GAF domain-containing sensor histidine kinase [SAR324 cluster bacterium]|uniref:histidine kinase n=1 Tax=SAR324 cluster bacterium TaxID=2024889 RepID=A0A7X9FRI8_9DELT|nr:GAF domain-containing sensor histidine kinase [SAR324 cluster bacterium]
MSFLKPEDVLKNRNNLSSQEADILNKINEKVAGAESFDAIMDFIFDSTKDIFPCDRIAVAFLEDNDRRVITRAVRTKYNDLHLGNCYSAGLANSTLFEVLQNRHLRIINDLECYLEFKPNSAATSLIIQEGIRSSLTCPLIVEDRPVGFLFRNSTRPNAYGEHEVLLHVLMAERLSQAVEKAWRISQLRAANAAYMEMLAFASHELKSPLASISMECEMLLEGYIDGLNEAMAASIKRIKSKVQTLLESTDDFLTLARYEGGRLQVEVIEEVDILAHSVFPALENVASLAAARNIKICIEPQEGIEPIRCDPRAFRIIFTNLIGNAIKYGIDGGEVKVSLSKDSQSFKACVWNNGPGFPPDEQVKLFKRFSRLYVPEYRKVKGSGVGLYIVWQLIDMHNGTINARSEYGKWAEFYLSIPQ